MTIRKTCPCNVYPLEPHFYIAKLGYAGVYMYLFFLFLLQNIDCGYTLEPPRRGGSNVYPQSMFGAKIRKISKIFSGKFSIFKNEKSLFIAWASFRNARSKLSYLTANDAAWILVIRIDWRLRFLNITKTFECNIQRLFQL